MGWSMEVIWVKIIDQFNCANLGKLTPELRIVVMWSVAAHSIFCNIAEHRTLLSGSLSILVKGQVTTLLTRESGKLISSKTDLPRGPRCRLTRKSFGIIVKFISSDSSFLVSIAIRHDPLVVLCMLREHGHIQTSERGKVRLASPVHQLFITNSLNHNLSDRRSIKSFKSV